jgi:hypothetical protein
MSTELVVDGLEVDQEIKDAICRMKRGVSHLPPGMASFFYDLCRAEPRTKHPMGRYPEAAFTVAALGAPWGDVVAPMSRLKSALWHSHYAGSLPCLWEAVSRETEANSIQNHATHRVLRDPRRDSLDSFIESCDTQITETRIAKAVAVAMRAHK